MSHFYLKGKKYAIKELEDGSVVTEEVAVEEGEVVVEEEAIEEEVAEEPKADVATEAKKIASQIAKSVKAELGMDDVKALNDKVSKFLNMNTSTKLSQIVNGKDIFSSKDTLTAEEKIVGFYHALATNNEYAVKALSEGTPADGGYLFPSEFYAEIQRVMNDMAVMRNLVRVVKMKRNTMTIPTQDNHVKVYWTSENATKTTTTASFNQKVLTAYKAAAIIYASDELIDDSDLIDVVQLIIDDFATAIADEEDRVLTAGTGTGQPTGLTAATVGSTVTTTGNITFDNLINLETQLNNAYLVNAKFLMHKQAVAALRTIKDTTGRYIWQDGIAGQQPATIMGYPVVINNHLPKNQIFFGDFKKGYWLGDRQAMTVLMSQHTTQAFTKDQTAIRVVFRIAGDVVQPAAITKLVKS